MEFFFQKQSYLMATPENHHIINFADIRSKFGFKCIEMGRWVSESERDAAAVNFQNALNDLQTILNCPEILISLRGTLGLQFGIGGQLGVSAHYVPITRKLSLAKNAGAGSLAHEWFHAFDHHMGNKMFLQTSLTRFASELWLSEQKQIKHPLNDLLAQCFESILLSSNGQQPSDLFKASKAMDTKLGCFYYSKPEEICARAFEAFIEDRAPHNRFLVKGTRHSEEAQYGLYPKGQQRQAINLMFEQYFAMLGHALVKQKLLQQNTMTSMSAQKSV